MLRPHLATHPGRDRTPLLISRALSRAVGAGLAVLAASGSLPAEARAGSSPRDPVDLRSSFGSDRLPPGWRVEAGGWKAVDGSFFETPAGGALAGLLRTNGLAVAESDFRIELWAEFAEGDPASPGRSPALPRRSPDAGAGLALAVSWGGITAGLMEPGRHSAFVSFAGPEGDREMPQASPDVMQGGAFPGGRFPGRFRMEMSDRAGTPPRPGGPPSRGVVSVRTGRGPWYSRRNVFGRSAGARPKEIAVMAGPGVRIYAARVRTKPCGPPSPSAAIIADGDRSYREGDLAAAQACYAVAKLDGDSPPSRRAEAAYKYGVVVAASGNPTAAGHAREATIRLDPEGPWGERARLLLAEAAFEAGDAELALGLARGIAANTPSGIEEWDGFRSLVSRAREELVEAGAGPKATFMLRGMAERIEWASRRRERASWMWGEVALAYASRGWHAEAEALRARSSRLLGRKVRSAGRKVTGRKPGPDGDDAEEREDAPVPGRPDEDR